VAHAENSHGEVSFSGIWWSFAFGVRCLWRHNLTSHLCFQTTFWRGLLTQYAHSSTRNLLILCHCTEYKLSAVQVRISQENTLNPTTQQFISAKISGFALKQESKPHSSLRQSNLQLQNQAALMSRRIGYEQWRIVVRLDWLTHTPVCKIESC